MTGLWFLKKGVQKTVAGLAVLRVVADPAMINEVGGINLDPRNLKTNIYKDTVLGGAPVRFDSAMIQRIKHDGFTGLGFRIVSIKALTNLSSFLEANKVSTF